MQTRKALKNLSGGKVNYHRVSSSGPLADNAEWLLRAEKHRQTKIEEAKKRHDIAAALPIIEAAKRKLTNIIGDRVLPDDTPIATRFDVFTAIKDASRRVPRDIGVKKMSTHMERIWHEEPLGSITAGAISRIRNYYQSNHPSSEIGRIVDSEIPKIAFNTLPVAQLTRIASSIDTQDDYNEAIVRNGLHRNTSKSIRARAFIREMINRKQNIAVVSENSNSTSHNCSGNIAKRVAERILHTAKDVKLIDDDENSPETSLGVDGTGVLNLEAMLKEQDLMHDHIAKTGIGMSRNAVAPKGWEGTVKEMKEHKDIKNPWALAHWMESKGYEPHYTEEGKKKDSDKGSASECAESECSDMEAATPYGRGWSEENVVEIASDAISEMNNPQVMQLVNKAVQGYVNAMGMQMPEPGSKAFGEALVGAFQSDPSMMRKVQDVIYKSIMAEEPTLGTGEVSPQYTEPQVEPTMMPAMAHKTAADKSENNPDFDPKVNQQQPDQVAVPDCGCEALISENENKQLRPNMKADRKNNGFVLQDYAVKAEHPLVDDGCDHYPMFNQNQFKASIDSINEMKTVPEWWLGSIEELSAVVKTAGEIPEAFKKNIKKKDKKKKDKEDDKECDDNPFVKGSRCAALGFTKESIETQLLSHNGTVRNGNLVITTINNNGAEFVRVAVGDGSRTYPLTDLDDAIADFMYLVDTAKVSTQSPPPFFSIREGIRMQCPKCFEINSYEMPKTASDITCGKCTTIVPAKLISQAMSVNNHLAQEEVVIVAFIPNADQKEFGDKLAKIANNLKADHIGAEGCIAEVYATKPSDEHMANIWDEIFAAGFKPIAQDMQMPMDIMPGMDSLSLETPGEGPELSETPEGGQKWADPQMIQAAMMHYQAQGNSVTEAVTQFTKDYGDSYDPEMVMQIAATVYGIGLDTIKIGMKYLADQFTPSVNTQQPDTVKPEKLGPDTEQNAGPSDPKVKTQVKPQGTFSNTECEGDSETKDPGDFGAGKPKQTHLPKEQSGTSLSDTNLGQDSETGDNSSLSKKMDQVSKVAPSTIRSK